MALRRGRVVVLSALVPVVSETPIPIQAMVAALIVVIIGQEFAAARSHPPGDPPIDRRWFYTALALIAAAGAFSLADVTRTFCDPKNHLIQGHAIWHLLSALALFALFRFYEGVPNEIASDHSVRGRV
jgi:hypothetical protein